MTKVISKLRVRERETKEIKFEQDITPEIFKEMLEYDIIWHTNYKKYLNTESEKHQKQLQSIEKRLNFLSKIQDNKSVTIDKNFLKALCLNFKNKKIKINLISMILSNDMTKHEIEYTKETKDENEM